MLTTIKMAPSDLAPHRVQFDPETLAAIHQALYVHDIIFNQDSSMAVRFFIATKNDSTRTGFKVSVPLARQPQGNPG